MLKPPDQIIAEETVQPNSVDGKERSKASTALWAAVVCAFVAVACLVIPIYVIRPLRPQGARELAFALTVRAAAPWLTAACVVVVLWVLFSVLRRKTGTLARIAVVALSFIALVSAVLTHVNIFEIMFHPYPSPVFGEAGSVQVNADDKVLAVRIGAVAHAYPVLIMGYHHIVNYLVADVPIAVTYCTLCHAGLVWNRVVDGKTLYFRLAGINNGNALMRDEQTSSIWQQSTGQAIFGPLKGSQLKLIRSDELTFGLWRKEQPHGLVLEADAPYASEYESRDWEAHLEKTPTVVDTRRTGILPHELMLGLTVCGKSKAYPVKSILTARLIQDQIAGDSPAPDRFQKDVCAIISTSCSLTSVDVRTSVKYAQPRCSCLPSRRRTTSRRSRGFRLNSAKRNAQVWCCRILDTISGFRES